MKYIQKYTERTMHFFSTHMSPEHLFIVTLLCFPSFVFQSSIWCALVQLFLCMTLVFLRKGKIKLLPSFFIASSIIFFNILNPYGKILLHIGTFPVTAGAIESGVRRATVLLGMVFISQFSISKNLHIPGILGNFIGMMFYYFEKITETKINFKLRTLLDDIDERLLAVYYESIDSYDAEVQEVKTHTDIKGVLFLSSFFIFMWGLFLLPFLIDRKSVV